MKINKYILKELNPCKDRFDNFLKHYPSFEGSFDEFIDLEHVSYHDKIWVGDQILNKNQFCHFGLLCAESVLYIFEEKYPLDKRVRKCIEYLTKIPNFSNLTNKQIADIKTHKYASIDAVDAASDAANTAKIKQEKLNLQFLKIAASL